MKHRTRRFLSLLLAMAMCLSFASPAWAAETDPADELTADTSAAAAESETGVGASSKLAQEEKPVEETSVEEPAEEEEKELTAEEEPAKEKTSTSPARRTSKAGS